MADPGFFPFPEINTPRLCLRNIALTDASELFFLRADERVMQFIGREKAKSIEEVESFIQLIADLYSKNESLMWAITLREDPATLIGTINFWRILKDHYRAELGYVLNPSHWNKGIMKEAISAVVDYGFGPMQLHSIEARINPDNVASAKVLENSGFIREAYFKEDFFFKGNFFNTAVYSLVNG